MSRKKFKNKDKTFFKKHVHERERERERERKERNTHREKKE